MRIRNPAILTVLSVIEEIQTFAQLQDLRHVHNYLHQTQGGEYKRGIFRDFFYFYVRYSTLLHQPPRRFHCDGRMLESNPEGTLATLALTVKRSNHLARSHPPWARSHPQAEKKRWIKMYLVWSVALWQWQRKKFWDQKTSLCLLKLNPYKGHTGNR